MEPGGTLHHSVSERLSTEQVKGQDEERMCPEETGDIVCETFSSVSDRQDVFSGDTELIYKHAGNESSAINLSI